MSVDLVQQVLKADNLPSLPTVALEVLKLTRKDDVSVDALAKVVQNDPALTAKILKVVNSSLFGVPREIGSIKQAMVILGLRTVKVMALSFALVETVRKTGDEGLNLEEYWRRSLTTAVAARLLGKVRIPKQAEEAFVAGLLTDLGLFAAWRCAPQAYAPVLAQCENTGETISAVELRMLGVTHAELGREMLKHWNLPDPVCASVGSHHGLDMDALSGESLAMAEVVQAAAAVADMFCGHVRAADLSELRAQLIEFLGVDEGTLDRTLTALDGFVKETASLLSLDIGRTTTYAQLQMEAAMQLANVGMEAEMERAAAARREQQARDEAIRLQEEKQAILEVASTDALTRIANRRAFDKRLADELSSVEGASAEVGLILLDVDHFKKFNDTHGHQAGDEVLRRVAACLSDVASHAGLVARYGGEEFAVICVNNAARQVSELAEQIRSAIENCPVEYDGKSLTVTASLGVARSTATGRIVAPAALVETADQRLYAAKRAGRNRVAVQ